MDILRIGRSVENAIVEASMKNYWIALVLAACILGGCGGGDDDYAGPAVNSAEYQVTAPLGGSAFITYRNSSGGTEQVTAKLPWNYYLINPPTGTFLYVSAQSQSATTGVTVTLKTSGNVVKSATSSGAYGIATVSASCC